MQETASVEMLAFDGAKGCSSEDLVSDGASVGRSAPLHPLGGRGARGLRPSHALPGLCWRGFGFLTVRAFRRRIWLPTKQAWGAPLPYTPSGDGVREGATLSRSPGAVLAGIWVFTKRWFFF